jgi:hypothetical protein
LVLRLVIAGFAAVGTVVLAVLGKSQSVIRLAQGAVLDASAASFGLIANQAAEFFVGHTERVLGSRNMGDAILLLCENNIKAWQIVEGRHVP